MAANYECKLSSLRKWGQSVDQRLAYILEQAQHFIVSRVVGQEEGQIRSAEDGGYANQTGAATGDNGNILPGVLALLALAMRLVVEVGDGLAEGLDAGGGAVLAGGHGNVNGVGTGETAGNVVFDLGGTLAEVGPFLGVFHEAVLAGALGAPDDAGGGAAGVEAGMGHVAFVGIAELAVDFGLDLCRRGRLAYIGGVVLHIN